jgi:hypothetical protein
MGKELESRDRQACHEYRAAIRVGDEQSFPVGPAISDVGEPSLAVLGLDPIQRLADRAQQPDDAK